MSDHTDLTFEQAYGQLADIVQRLESSSLPLNDALRLFEQGQQLAAYCQKLLDGAELRISQLIDGEIVPLE